MCILITSNKHPDYPLIILSNRDEYFDRPTSSARFWDAPNGHVLSPRDEQRTEHGTWIGMTRTGRITALLNCHEENNDDAISKVSRGLFTRQFLTATDSSEDWLAKEMKTYGPEGPVEAGGFYMFMGTVSKELSRFGIFSNRGGNKLVMDDRDGPQTVALTNGEDDSWAKIPIGVAGLNEAISAHPQVSDLQQADLLIDDLFQVLSKDTYPRDESPTVYNLRKSVFIPKLPFNNAYGTRTQTVILVDREGNARYIEKNLVDPLISEFRFHLDSFPEA